MHSRTSRFTLLLIILIAPLLGEPDTPEVNRVKLLHPKQDMQFWVDKIEVAGDIPNGTDLQVNGNLVSPDDEGRFRHLVDLDHPVTLIQLVEQRGQQTFLDTIRVFHRNMDHMLSDSIFVNNNIPDSLSINFVYPLGGRYRGSEVSLRGRTHPEALLTMNGEPMMVYPSGAYTTHVELVAGINTFEFEAILGRDTVTQALILERPTGPEAIQDMDPNTAEPRRPQWIMAGERLNLGIRSAPGESISYKIPGHIKWQEMEESRPGYYTATLLLRDVKSELNTTVLYRSGVVSKRARSASLRILTDAVGGITSHEDTRVYDTPSTDQLLFPLSDSISVQVIGLENNMYRISLGEYRTAYVLANRVKLQPESKLTTPHYLGSMQSETVSDWSIFRIHTGRTRLPFEIKEKAIPSRLELKVFGAKQGWEWTTYPEDDNTVKFLERSQPEDLIWQMDFYPQSNFWGWYAYYEGDFLVIGIRKAPSIAQERPFAGIRIEIDPGHGGWQRGAIGVTGYAEADANLRYSQKLEKLLKEAGATVFMTRRDDHQISLADRAEIARNDSVHIFVMAHNNAPGSRTDILTASGASTFYTWPSSKALSDNLYPYLGDMGIESSGKVSRYYYYLTRQTEYLVYLIEGAFMTHPEDEMFLLSEEGLDKLAQSAFKGLEDFLLEQAD